MTPHRTPDGTSSHAAEMATVAPAEPVPMRRCVSDRDRSASGARGAVQLNVGRLHPSVQKYEGALDT